MTRATVLLVGDDLEFADAADALLAAHDVEVIGAQTGTTALNLLHETSPDLIVTARALPDMEPLALVTSIRRSAGFDEVPVVVVLPDDQPAHAVEAMDGGADACLVRPVRDAELLAQVTGLLAAARARQELSRISRDRAALLEMNALLSAARPWEQVLREVAQRVATLIPYSGAALAVLTPDRRKVLVVTGSTGGGRFDLGEELELDRHPELAEVADRGKRLLRDRAGGAPIGLPTVPPAGGGLGAGLGLALFPVLSHRKTQGVLIVQLPYPASELGQGRVQLCETIAELASARVTDVRRELARERVEPSRASWLESDAVRTSWMEPDESVERHKLLVNLVEHSADAIVAADMDGLVRIFNQSAEQLFGHASEDVIGEMNVEYLALAGTAQEHMRLMRSHEYGEPGFVHDLVTEVVSRDGEIVPVRLSAAILHEGAEEVAAVGIFHDLRERLALESRLQAISAQLVESEKQAALVALAGAAAHEINQPLTTVMGLIEMLQLRCEDAALHGQLERVYAETERMSNIVQRIGRITRVQTTRYVGETEILDLDKSSEVK